MAALQNVDDAAHGDVHDLDLKVRSLTTIAEILRIHGYVNGDAELRGTDLKKYSIARLVRCLAHLFARDVGEKVAFAVILDNQWNVFDASAAASEPTAYPTPMGVPSVSDGSSNPDGGDLEACANTLAPGRQQRMDIEELPELSLTAVEHYVVENARHKDLQSSKGFQVHVRNILALLHRYAIEMGKIDGDPGLASDLRIAFDFYTMSIGIRRSMARFQMRCKPIGRGYISDTFDNFLKRTDRSVIFGDTNEILNKDDPIPKRVSDLFWKTTKTFTQDPVSNRSGKLFEKRYSEFQRVQALAETALAAGHITTDVIYCYHLVLGQALSNVIDLARQTNQSLQEGAELILYSYWIATLRLYEGIGIKRLLNCYLEALKCHFDFGGPRESPLIVEEDEVVQIDEGTVDDMVYPPECRLVWTEGYRHWLESSLPGERSPEMIIREIKESITFSHYQKPDDTAMQDWKDTIKELYPITTEQDEWINRIDERAAETANRDGFQKGLSFQNFSEKWTTSFQGFAHCESSFAIRYRRKEIGRKVYVSTSAPCCELCCMISKECGINMGPWETKKIVKSALPKDCPLKIAKAVVIELQTRVRDMLDAAKGRINVHQQSTHTYWEDESPDFKDDDCESGVQ